MVFPDGDENARIKQSALAYRVDYQPQSSNHVAKLQQSQRHFSIAYITIFVNQ